MIDFKKARFVVSAPSPSLAPKDGIPAVLMIGRSNVGKSTLLNALMGQKIAFASKKAGKTKLLNYFLVDDSLYLVDAPGYGSTGYATMSTIHFATMMEEYVKVPSLKAICLLLDLRREPEEDDKKFVSYLQNTGKPIIAILTKVDQMNQSERHKAEVRAKELGLERVLKSDLKGKSIDKIRTVIASYGK